MYSIQEMVNKCEKQLKEVEQSMDASGGFHPEDANIFNGQSRAVTRELHESLHGIGLPRLLEYLAKSGTADIAGAAYLVPDAVSQTLYKSAKRFDIVPLISMAVLTQWSGGDLDVQVAYDDEYEAKYFGSGGDLPTETVHTAQATLKPRNFGISPRINNNLIEDQQYDLLNWHIERAGEKIAQFASKQALQDLMDSGDGDGTQNTVTSANGDETLPSEVLAAFDANGADGFVSDTLITTPEAWSHSIAVDATAAYYPTGVTTGAPAPGFHMKFHNMDVLFRTDDCLYTGAWTAAVSLIFDRKNALLTGRKRWLAMEKYANPVADLAGAVVSARQDSVTVYNDACCELTETT